MGICAKGYIGNILGKMMNPSSIAFAGTLGEAEFFRIRHAFLPVWLRWYFSVPVLLIFFIQISSGWGQVLLEPQLVVPDVLYFLLVFAGVFPIVRFGRRRSLREFLRTHGPVRGQITADGLEWRTEATVASLPWSKLIGHRISRDVVLLYYAPRCAFFLPRSFFAGEQEWGLVRQLVRDNSHPI